MSISADTYRLTLPGGIKIEEGRLSKICLAVLTIPAGRSVFIRPVDATYAVLELRTPDHLVTYTVHGSIQPTPDWAQALVNLIRSNL